MHPLSCPAKRKNSTTKMRQGTINENIMKEQSKTLHYVYINQIPFELNISECGVGQINI